MSFSFVDQIQQKYNTSSESGSDPVIRSSSNIFVTVTNTVDAIDETKSILLSGKDCREKPRTIGNKYFTQSGTCDSTTSVPECQGQARYLYVDNVPTPTFPCVDPSQPVDSNCASQGYTGLLPGMIQDVMAINPFEFMASAGGRGSAVSDTCVLRTENVGYQDIEGDQLYSQETRCAPPRKSLVCSLQLKESFLGSKRVAGTTGSGSSRYHVLFLLALVLLLCALRIFST